MANEKILIVDDEPYIARQLSFVLEKEGFDVSVAVDGEEALAKIKESTPKLLFLDVMMPKKNGYEVCEELKRDPSFNEIYIIMLTAKGQESDREKGLALGADEFITKPFSLMQIVGRVKEILASYPSLD